MSLAKLTSKGQITLPKPIREYLELHTGDKVEFTVDSKGRVVVTSKTVDVADAFSMIKPRRIVSTDDMKKAIARKFNKKYRK